MKKKYYIIVLLFFAIFLLMFKNYYDYKLDVSNPCVTKEKIDRKTSEYEKYVYDENENLIFGGYDKLREVFYNDITQNGKYKLYLIVDYKKTYISNYHELEKYYFPNDVLERHFKNEKSGQEEYIIVERVMDNKEIFKIKKYQIYPYKKMINLRYAGSASIMVQFKCALENNRKK